MIVKVNIKLRRIDTKKKDEDKIVRYRKPTDDETKSYNQSIQLAYEEFACANEAATTKERLDTFLTTIKSAAEANFRKIDPKQKTAILARTLGNLSKKDKKPGRMATLILKKSLRRKSKLKPIPTRQNTERRFWRTMRKTQIKKALGRHKS